MFRSQISPLGFFEHEAKGEICYRRHIAGGVPKIKIIRTIQHP
jgi:hypothetical protein